MKCIYIYGVNWTLYAVITNFCLLRLQMIKMKNIVTKKGDSIADVPSVMETQTILNKIFSLNLMKLMNVSNFVASNTIKNTVM